MGRLGEESLKGLRREREMGRLAEESLKGLRRE